MVAEPPLSATTFGLGFGIRPGAGGPMADRVTGAPLPNHPTPFRFGRFSDRSNRQASLLAT
jgi:hypothetical protein